MCRSCQVLWLVTWVSAAIRSTVWVYKREREIGKARQGLRLLLGPIATLHQSPAHTLLMLRAIHVSFIIDNPTCTCNVYHTHYKEFSYSLALAMGHGPWRFGGPICKLAISFTSVCVTVHNTLAMLGRISTRPVARHVTPLPAPGKWAPHPPPVQPITSSPLGSCLTAPCARRQFTVIERRRSSPHMARRKIACAGL